MPYVMFIPLAWPVQKLLVLAQLPDPKSAESMGWILLALASLFAALNQGAAFVDRFRRKPSESRIVKIEEAILTDKDLDRIESGSRQRKADSDQRIAAVKEDSESEIARLDGEIDEITRNFNSLHTDMKASDKVLAAVQQQCTTHTQQLAAVDQKLTNILQRLPRRGIPSD